jgi:hypothetical protein
VQYHDRQCPLLRARHCVLCLREGCRLCPVLRFARGVSRLPGPRLHRSRHHHGVRLDRWTLHLPVVRIRWDADRLRGAGGVRWLNRHRATALEALDDIAFERRVIMSAFPGLSRRALVAATAALAAAPAIEAKKKKRKRKKKPPAPPPPPPLATALMTVSNVTDIGDAFDCDMAGAWRHLASEASAALSVSVLVPVESTGAAVQAFLVTTLQGLISVELANNAALDVPPERIAVTLI